VEIVSGDADNEWMEMWMEIKDGEKMG